MILELAGAPGAGKTTLGPQILSTLRSFDMDAVMAEDAVRPVVRSTLVGRLLRPLPPGGIRRAIEWRLFLLCRLTFGLAALAARPRLLRLLWVTQRRRPAEAHARDRRVLHWLVRAIGAAQFLSPRIEEDRVVVVDEGVVHRTVQLFTSPFERADRDTISRYVADVPHPDVVVIVEAPPEICAERAIERGGRHQWGWSEEGDVRAYVSNAHEAIRLTCRALRTEGVPVVVVDSAGGATPGWAAELEHVVSGPGRRVER